MKIYKNENIQIGIIIVLIVIIGLAISWIDNSNISLCKNKMPYSILFGIAMFFIFWLRSYLKRNIKKNKIEQNLEFFKVLLPTSLSLLGTIWLFSSGYLNLRSENLKKEIFIKKAEDSLLLIRLKAFRKDSTRLFNEVDSITIAKSDLEADFEAYKKMTVNEIRKMTNEKRKVIEEYEKVKQEIKKLNSNVVDSINSFLFKKGFQDWIVTRVLCTNKMEDSGMVLTVHDRNGNILTDKDIIIYTRKVLPNQDCLPQISRFDDNTKKFKVQHSANGYKGDLRLNQILIKINNETKADCDLKADFQFETTFDNAEYQVTLYKFDEKKNEK